MTPFTVLGLAIAIFVALVIVSILFNVFCEKDMEDSIGFILVLVCISAIIAIFIAKPQMYGYEKITVSENSIEEVR